MYEFVVRGPEFELKGREYKRGDRVTGADVVAVSADPHLVKRCIRVARPADSTGGSIPTKPAGGVAPAPAA